MYDESLADRVRLCLSSTSAFTERRMFGGLAFLIGGNMACGIVRDELMVRTGAANHEAALARPHARPKEFTGRPMRGMVFVAREGLDHSGLVDWVELGATYAAGLPEKNRK
jgi:TfoX/Sxy family transcriptional regulator of competence genes